MLSIFDVGNWMLYVASIIPVRAPPCASSLLFQTQERVFKDLSMRLYEYDERSLPASIPICISECPMLSLQGHSVYNTHCLAVLGHIYNLAAQN